jgi:hypothetical protein
MTLTIPQIVAILIGLVNLALYFFNWQDAMLQIKYLLWVFISVVVFLNDDQLLHIADMFNQLNEEDGDNKNDDEG